MSSHSMMSLLLSRSWAYSPRTWLPMRSGHNQCWACFIIVYELLDKVSFITQNQSWACFIMFYARHEQNTSIWAFDWNIEFTINRDLLHNRPWTSRAHGSVRDEFTNNNGLASSLSMSFVAVHMNLNQSWACFMIIVHSLMSFVDVYMGRWL